MQDLLKILMESSAKRFWLPSFFSNTHNQLAQNGYRALDLHSLGSVLLLMTSMLAAMLSHCLVGTGSWHAMTVPCLLHIII